jgi:hypothetical protein
MHRKSKEVRFMPGKPIVVITLLLIVCCMVLVIPAYATDKPADNALTRGSRFSVNITGSPSTPYYVWLTRTSAMTGEPGDQPPVIVAFQSNIQQDPPEGPYTIGSYVFQNGNGRTIREDVAPSTPEISNTRYYALVTTDTDGRAVVTFQTSSATATRTFSIKVENPSSAGEVVIERGLPTRIMTVPFPKPTLIVPETTTTATGILTESPPPPTIVPTTIPLPIPTSSHRSAPGYGYGILAIVAGILVWKRKEFFR